MTSTSRSRLLGTNLKIIHFNVESISRAKCDVLSQILNQYDVSVLCLQETHSKDEQDLRSRGLIPGYDVVGAIHHPQYGIATYVRSNITDVLVLSENS